MADFVAVLKKTIEGLNENTPEVRAKVYAKARATIDAKLAALNPPPPAAVAERQRQAIETAIEAVEQSYAPPAEEIDELDSFFENYQAEGAPVGDPYFEAEQPSTVAQAFSPEPEPEPEPEPVVPAGPHPEPDVAKIQADDAPRFEPEEPVPSVQNEPAVEPETAAASPAQETPTSAYGLPRASEFDVQSSGEEPVSNDEYDRDWDRQAADHSRDHLDEPQRDERFDGDVSQPSRAETDDEDDLDVERSERTFIAPPLASAHKRKSRTGALIAALVVLLVIGGGAYAAWTNRDAVTAFLGLQGSGELVEGTDLPDDAQANADGEEQLEPSATPDTATDTDAGEQDAVASADPDNATDMTDDAASQTASQPASGSEPVRKFTQRLQSDGTEVDEGPANGGLSIGEGTSVAELTQNAQAQSDEPDATPGATPGGTPAAPVSPNGAASTQPQSDQAVAVGQRAIFYEERTSSQPATAESGSIVWSVVQESPGGDAPAEPAIRGEATIPGKDLQLRMTIRRNTDPTLPASHIMEMIFLMPDGFEGGGIQNVVRVAMKDTEQATGSPLLGIPARIADGFFLVALSDSPAEIQANMNLLNRQNWLDIPLIYQSGRRALITLEKGVPGERVFEEAIRAWQGNVGSN